MELVVEQQPQVVLAAYRVHRHRRRRRIQRTCRRIASDHFI